MPRQPRLEVAGGVHHVTARTVHGRLLFRDDADHRAYLALLASEVARRRWSLYSWCHMPNHLHLLLRTDDPDLGRGMKVVHEQYATYVNERYAEHGHVFGDRFHNRLVRDDAHFVASLRYIARNPVSAGLCASASRWSWSAHRALAGLEPAPAFLAVADALGVLAGDEVAQHARYVDLVAGGDVDLVRDMARADTTHGWLIAAVEHHRIPVAVIGEALGIGATAVYKRLAAARRRAQPDPAGD